MRHMHTLCSKM